MPLVAPWASGVRYWATDNPEPPPEILELLKSGGARRQNMVSHDGLDVCVPCARIDCWSEDRSLDEVCPTGTGAWSSWVGQDR